MDKIPNEDDPTTKLLMSMTELLQTLTNKVTDLEEEVYSIKQTLDK